MSLPVDLVDRHAAGNGSLKKLYVGNLPFSTTEEELREIFEQHGPTVSVRVITDRETGRSRGFGFVEMGTPEEAKGAIEALSNSELEGRNLVVSEAKPQESRGDRGSGGSSSGRSRW